MSMHGHELAPQTQDEGPDELIEGMACARYYALVGLRDAAVNLSKLKQYATYAERTDIADGCRDALAYLENLINDIERNLPEA